jgi:hypothetical protein
VKPEPSQAGISIFRRLRKPPNAGIWERAGKAVRLPFLPVWLAPVILLAPVWIKGEALFWGTPYLQFIPWWSWAWQTLRSGHLPLWNPLVGMGVPLAANYQSALFYPATWISFLLSSIGGVSLMAWGQTWVVIAHLILAGVGMARLAQRLNLNATAQAVCALAFELCGYMAARAGFFSINAAAAWLPWILLAGINLTGQGKTPAPRVLALALCLGVQFLAGHAQTTYYTWLLLVVWVVFWGWQAAGWRGSAKALVGLAFASGLAVGLAAVQLLPTAEYLQQSQRASSVDYDTAMNYSFFPLRFLTLLAANLFGSPATGSYMLKADNYWEDAVYIGLLPLLLALSAATSLFRRKAANPPRNGMVAEGGKPLIWFLSLICAVSFLLALGKNTSVFPFLYHNIPTFNLFQAPARLTLWAEFGLALLAGVGVHHWQRPTGWARYWTNLGSMGAVAVSLGAGLALILLPGVATTFVAATALVGVFGLAVGLLSKRAPQAVDQPPGKAWSWLVVILVGVDLLIAHWGLNPGAPLDLYRPETSQVSPVSAMLGTHRLYIDPVSEDVIKYQRFFRFNSFIPQEDWNHLNEVLLPDSGLLSGIASANNFDPLVPGRYARWMEYLSQADSSTRVNMLAAMDVSVSESAEPASPDKVKFYALPGSTRLYWTACAAAAANEQQAWELVISRMSAGQADEHSQREPVILEGLAASSGVCQDKADVTPLLMAESPNRVTIKTNASQDGWVVLADTWYPGWQVKVDGRSTPLFRADYLFKAAAVPAGEHTVEFTYQPASALVGLVISLASLAGIMMFCIVARGKAR